MEGLPIFASLLMLACGAPRPVPAPAEDPYAGGSNEQSATRQLCAIGEFSPDVPKAPIERIVVEPEKYRGKRVRTRGFLILEFERMMVLEPTLRKDALGIVIRRLPVAGEEDLLVCRHRLVDVEGPIGIIPVRGGERTVIFGEAMADTRPDRSK